MSNPMPLDQLIDLVRQAAYASFTHQALRAGWSPTSIVLQLEGTNLVVGRLEEMTWSIAAAVHDVAVPPGTLMCGGCLDRQLRDGTEPKPAVTVVMVIGAACEDHLLYALKRWGSDSLYARMEER